MPSRKKRSTTRPTVTQKNQLTLFWKFVTQPRPRFNSFINTLTAIAALIVSVIGLEIAINTYREQQVSGPKQQAAIDSSRASLEAVRRILDNSAKRFNESSLKQQRLLDSSVLVASRQLSILDAQRKDQLRKPNFQLLFQYSVQELPKKFVYSNDSYVISYPSNHGDTELGKWLTLEENSKILTEAQVINQALSIPVNQTVNDSTHGTRYFKLTTFVRNVGDANAVNVQVDTKNPDLDNVLVEGSTLKARLLTYKTTKDQIILESKVTFWRGGIDIDKVYRIFVSIYAENAPLRIITIRFKIVNSARLEIIHVKRAF